MVFNSAIYFVLIYNTYEADMEQAVAEVLTIGSLGSIPPYIIIILLAGAIATIAATFLGPYIAYMIEIRKSYIIPFKKWCAELYGELVEFEGRYYHSSNVKPDPNNNPYSYIIDLRDLHNTLIKSFQWKPIIERSLSKEGFECLNNLLNDIDGIWHSLQYRYGFNLQGEGWESELVKLDNVVGIANDKKGYIEDDKNLKKYFCSDSNKPTCRGCVEVLKKWLEKQAPKSLMRDVAIVVAIIIIIAFIIIVWISY